MAERKPRRPGKQRPPRRRPRAGGKSARRRPAPRGRGTPAAYWLYGRHAVLAALANPRRRCHRLLVAGEAEAATAAEVAELLAARTDVAEAESVDRSELAALLPAGAVHQGLALAVEPLRPPALEALLPALASGRQAVVLLDQVSDPQNAGAVLRAAAAFGAAAVVTTRANAPAESGVLAKAASGGLEHVPYLQVANLARAVAALQDAGFLCLGLAGEAEAELPAAAAGSGRVAVVLGAEGAGLRRLTRERCDALVRLPTRGPIGDLNVAAAAAVALYELLGRGEA